MNLALSVASCGCFLKPIGVIVLILHLLLSSPCRFGPSGASHAAAEGLDAIPEIVGKLNVDMTGRGDWFALSNLEKYRRIRSVTNDPDLDRLLACASAHEEDGALDRVSVELWLKLEETGALLILERQLLSGPEAAEAARWEPIDEETRFLRLSLLRGRFSSLLPRGLPPLPLPRSDDDDPGDVDFPPSE